MRSLRAAVAGLALPIVLIGAGCSTNPATGKRQVNMFSEEQEVALGRQNHEQIVQQLGLYEDRELQSYVQELGRDIASRSERPNLPWNFAVVDDASVNAFALPGGYIYVTRGMMSHLTSEAELVGVLGHEAGHVTARHSVNQISKQQLTQIGLMAGMILGGREAQQYGDLANLAGGLMFLKFSRDDERQADELGLRYMEAGGYPPQAMGEVFGLLSRVSAAEQKGRLPNWLATHPNPEERQRMVQAQYTGGSDPAAWRGERYLGQVDGIVYGADPREGFFRQSVFYHPELGFTMRSPSGWKGVNQKQAVVWQSPQGDAVFALTHAQARDPRAAAEQFFNQQGVQVIEDWPVDVGSGSIGRQFAAQTQQGTVVGAATFFEHRGTTLQLLSFGSEGGWRNHRNEIARAMQSFDRLDDRRYTDVDPMRIDVVTVDRAMTMREFDRRFPSTVDLDEVSLINQRQPDDRIEPGARIKRVVGGIEGAENTTDG
jgi:predicted Zn-dependent protease